MSWDLSRSARASVLSLGKESMELTGSGVNGHNTREGSIINMVIGSDGYSVGVEASLKKCKYTLLLA